jgi:GNAT superfamily N-acetyltransferase
MQVREIAGGRDLRRFIQVAWQINERDPMWVPPLLMATKKALDRRKHPFHLHADVAYFLAERNGKVVGRIAAIVNHLHNQVHEEKTGFFGLFECEDGLEAARALLAAAADWLRARGMERIRGPMNFSTNEEHSSPGVLIEGFDTPPVVMMSHNPPYYAGLIESAGFDKAKDLLSYWLEGLTPPERLVRGVERLAARAGVTTRPLDIKRFKDEVEAIKSIYNAAWSRNWGFVPMTEAEFDFMASELKPIVEPNLCFIAEAEGQPVGFSLTLPDFNQALKTLPRGRLFPFGIFRLLRAKRRITSTRVLTLGFTPRFQRHGLGALLYLRTWQATIDRGTPRGEASWILEDNLEMRRALENMGGVVYKRYRVYEKELGLEQPLSG